MKKRKMYIYIFILQSKYDIHIYYILTNNFSYITKSVLHVIHVLYKIDFVESIHTNKINA